MEFKLRPMLIEDIPRIVEIEKESFPTPWSPYAFSCEIRDNEFAYYLVVTDDGDGKRIYGYGGMWIIVDEAHITNIAVAKASRGQALGEFLMNGLIALAYSKRVSRMTLEVRVSNKTAQKLYEKLDFKSAGIRPGYYIDTNEDAIIMWKNIR